MKAFLLLVAVTAGVWATPVSGAATRSALLHLVVEGAALVAGTALFRSVLEASTVSGRLPVRDRVILLLVTGGFLGGFATALGTRTPVPGTTVAGAGVVSVAQVLSDQHRAATLLVAVAVALVALAAGEVLRAQRSRDRGKSKPAAA